MRYTANSFQIFTILVVFLWCGNHALTQTLPKKEVIIDEREQGKTIKRAIAIDKVWAGHPVGFALLTHQEDQYIAYYNADRHMVVGQRKLDEEKFRLFELPVFDRKEGKGTSTVVGWDSHNYITLDIDKEGFVHLSGNMHVHPLTYFKSTAPGDISSLVQIMEMVGTRENRCTYPKFMTTKDGELIFHYRDGGSGDGNEIYNIYSCETGKWSRLLDTPLTDGQGEMNAYASQPSVREDDWYHMYWVWRDTPDCETNHDLSYIKSPDMKEWYDAFGEKVTLPVTFDQKSVIVDPIPPGGGIINLAAKLVLDEDLKPIMAYHKYDAEGNLQFYVAKLDNGQWNYKQVTDWDYRWEFSGRGSINFDVRVGDFKRRDDGRYELGYEHIKYGTGTILLDKELNPIGEVLKPDSFLSEQEVEGEFAGLQVRTANDLGGTTSPVSYILKWETLPRNRDRPYPEPWPEPSQLYLYEME
jgi:hypothetical protein